MDQVVLLEAELALRGAAAELDERREPLAASLAEAQRGG